MYGTVSEVLPADLLDAGTARRSPRGSPTGPAPWTSWSTTRASDCPRPSRTARSRTRSGCSTCWSRCRCGSPTPCCRACASGAGRGPQRLLGGRTPADRDVRGRQGLDHRVQRVAPGGHGAVRVRVLAVVPGFTRTEFQERAGMDVSALRDAVWLEPEAVVAQALKDLALRRPISITGRRYRAYALAARHLPRTFVARRMARTRRAPAGRPDEN
ncbi:hypothetical protein WKI68_08615 [Streptomyces sp. MS1.HAVA.3]|uniref:SDR family oxidoreductase n=1 Tax=Streptomyces caledonius TaxID=3134107 RepID=A0ABU8U2T8_9ACTN